jgi:hypothetical protein
MKFCDNAHNCTFICTHKTPHCENENCSDVECVKYPDLSIFCISIDPEKEVSWKWLGFAGHHICAERCLFHLTTDVGRYLISTVGKFHPEMNQPPQRQLGPVDTVGHNRLYETAVFKKESDKLCSCGCGLPVINPMEIKMLPANDSGTATKNHMAMCREYGDME